jgi:hypothetical protein
MSSVKNTILSALKESATILEAIAVEDVGVIEKAGISALQALVNDLVTKINNKASSTTTTTTS